MNAAAILLAADVQFAVLETQNFVYVVFKSSECNIIAVRGTIFNSVSDWLINLKTHKNRSQQGVFHTGFLNEARHALPHLQRMVPEDCPLYLTGHSLGGAVAGVLGLIWEHPHLRTTHVFGAPRFTDAVTMGRKPLEGYMNYDDLVPHLPFKILGFADAGNPSRLIASQPQRPRSRWTIFA